MFEYKPKCSKFANKYDFIFYAHWYSIKRFNLEKKNFIWGKTKCLLILDTGIEEGNKMFM